MKLTPSEAKLVELIKAMPGESYCPGADDRPHSEVSRIVRRLERQGVLSVEMTDDGPRYTVRDGADG
jgi:predicted transcriptional regulator